jgi:Fic family protein
LNGLVAFIHTKRIGDTTYYTLRISYRKGGRVITKDIENLGTDLAKVRLEDLEQRHKKEIRKSYHSLKKFLDKNYYTQQVIVKKPKRDVFLLPEQQHIVEAAKLHYHKRFLAFDKHTQAEVFENFLIKFAVNSTSIEGNTITLEEAARLLKEDIVPKGKTLREVFDLKNTKTVFFWLKQERPALSLELIEQIHDQLLENIDTRKGYRAEDLRILGQPFTPSPGRYVKDDVKLLLDWHAKQRSSLHPLVLATLFHHKFENIHPFSDGNGRTGRMLMNHVLMEEGYPPIIIARRNRREYLDVMSGADAATKKQLDATDSKHYRELLTFIVQEFEETYWDTFLI